MRFDKMIIAPYGSDGGILGTMGRAKCIDVYEDGSIVIEKGKASDTVRAGRWWYLKDWHLMSKSDKLKIIESVQTETKK